MKDKGHTLGKHGHDKGAEGGAIEDSQAAHPEHSDEKGGGERNGEANHHRKPHAHHHEAKPAKAEPAAAGGEIAGSPADASGVPASEDRFLRLLADFDNFRRRTAREKDELYTRANEDLVRELIPVLDHMDIALEAAAAGDAAATAFAEGFRAVAQQLLAALGKFGVKVIDAEGKSFDPAEHEAISCMPVEGVAENMVARQTRRGYRLGDRLIRPAHVIVSSGATVAAGETAPVAPDGAVAESADPMIGKG